jgi:hypothetical protein
MIFSDGLAARLLVANLINTLKERGVIDEALVKKIYGNSMEQLTTSLSKLDHLSGETIAPEQPNDSNAGLEDLGLSDVDLDLWKEYFKEALNILRSGQDHKE